MEHNTLDQFSSDAKFMAWSRLANSYFYSLNEFESLKPEIIKAKHLISEYGLPDSKAIRNQFISAYFNALLFTKPEAKTIEPWYLLAMESYDDIANLEDKIILYNHLMLYNIWNGNLSQARMLYKDFLGINPDEISNPLIQMMRFTMCAQIEWLNMNNEQSIAHVEEGLLFSGQCGVSDWDAQLAGQAVYASISMRDFERAEAWLQKVELYKKPERVLDNAQYHYLRAWLSIHQNQSATALSHANRAITLTRQAAVPFTEATSHILLAQILYQRHDYSRAGWHISLALKTGKKMRSQHVLFAALLAASWVANDFHLKKIGLTRLKKAFKLGAQHGYYNLPGWPHDMMTELCQLALAEQVEPVYTCELIKVHQMQPPSLTEISPAWPWPVELFCFGSLRIRVRGEEIRIGDRQRRIIDLLKLLLIHPRGLSNHHICDALWPDAEGDSAMRSLHVTQLRLRKLLEHQKSLLVYQGRTHLNHAIVMNEMTVFRDLLSQVEMPPDDSYELLFDRLIQMYEGYLLGDSMDLSWVIGCREKIHIRFLGVVEFHISSLVGRGEYARAEKVCMQVLEIDALAEGVCFSLLKIYHASGATIKMVRLYKQYKLILGQRHGILPSTAMQTFFSSSVSQL